jgi:hypothetical protein
MSISLALPNRLGYSLFMANTVTVNGQAVAVVNTLSCGPGCTPHTYELRGGSYVYEIAGIWWLQMGGQSKRQVEVAR